MDHLLWRIHEGLPPFCLPYPVAGCSDIAASFGLPGDGEDCNDICLPHRFEVWLNLEVGTPMEISLPIPPCLKVCPWGPCPQNTDPSAAYAGGRPEEIDPDLPVLACWALDHQPLCTESREVALVVSHPELPGPRSLIWHYYASLQDGEWNCFDGVDNDGDCLVDMEDPDCW